VGLGEADKSGPGGSIRLEQRIQAPAEKVTGYISDFRNAKEWMAGVETVESLGGEDYRIKLDTPVGKLEPGVRITHRNESTVGWVYTSTVDGGGTVEVRPTDNGCDIVYTGDFQLKRKLLGRVARLAGMERFARRNGERSLVRLKALMEAGRY
jgi:carbon monoxide dehydrogenase subunit G